MFHVGDGYSGKMGENFWEDLVFEFGERGEFDYTFEGRGGEEKEGEEGKKEEFEHFGIL